MKFLIAGALMLAMVPFASSQTTNQKVSEANDEQELKRLEDEWLNTYVSGNKATFDRVVADDFTGTDESAVLRNKTQERELVQAPPPAATIKVSLTNEDVQLRIYGDTAIVTGRIVQKAERPGQDSFSFQSRFTDTLLKRQGRWQVVARHYSRVPAERTAIKVDPKIFDAYVGEYEIAPSIVFQISREGDKLISQTTGQPKVEMFPESEIGFFIKGVSAQFIFLRDEKGQVARLVALQDGRTIPMKRIK